MTDAHPHNGVPGVIVVAETTIHDLLANSGVAWDCQHQIATIQQMWEDLGNGRLDNERSAAVVFSDTVPDAADLVAAASTMAPFAVTVVVAWQEDKAAALKAAIQAQIAANAAADPNLDPNAPVYFVPARTGRTVLDGVLHAVRGSIAHPGQFRTNVDQPLTRISDTIAFNPAAQTAGPGGLPAAPPPLPAVSVAAPGLPPVTAATETRPPQQVDATAPTRPDQITIAVTSSKGGSGKCLVGESLIMDPVTGLRRRLDDLVAGDDPATVPAFDGRFVVDSPIRNRFYSGIKPTFRLRLRSGREIVATYNHPLLTSDGWRPLGEVEPGETIATPSRLPFPSQPEPMDDAELDLLALLLAEGGTTEQTTRFTNFDPSILIVAQNSADRLGIVLREVYAGQPGQYRLTGGHPTGPAPVGLCQCGCGQQTKTAPDTTAYRRLGYRAGDSLRFVAGHSVAETTLRALRRHHGLDFVAAKNKTMPKAAFRLPEDQLARFIALFWMCDGYAVTKGGGDLGVTLASRDLIEALQHLLLRFGIVSKVGSRVAKANGKTYPAWRLTVYSTSYATFRAKIPLWGDKAAGVATLADRTAAGRNPNVGGPTFSADLRRDLVSVSRHGAPRAAAEALGWNIETPISPSMVLFHKRTRRTGRQHLSLRGLRAWAEATDTVDRFGWIYDSEIHWDEIESITPAGDQMVYDIEVPAVHNFVANDVIVHNSTSALMLATTIAHASRAAGAPLKVALVDMDTRDGQLGSLIGKFLPTALNVRSEPRIDQQTLTKYLIHDPKLGIDCLLAPVRPRTADDLGPDFYRHVIRILKTTHDVVIMDTSVNYLDPLIATVCLPESTAILFVTTMAQTAVQGMARALREITEPVEQGGMGISRSRIGVVVNQAVAGVGMETDQVIQAALKVRIIGSIPMASRDVLLATNNNAMHVLTQHPYLAPAYFNLAKVCLRDRPLAPATKEMGQGAAEAPQQPPAAAGPQAAAVDVPAGQPPAPVAVPVGAGPVGGPGPDVVPDGPGDGRKKRGLFGRRG